MALAERVAEAVAETERQGLRRDEIAATLISFAARYALGIGWSPELVSGSQREALQLHCDSMELPRP